MQRTQIYLTDEQEIKIKKFQKQIGGMTKSEIIRRALDLYLESLPNVNR
jgi:hypothetical protein